MAFRDENGKITIDEQAAQQDIKKLNRSKESLTTAIDHLKEIIALASEFSGNTGTVITETALQLQKQIQGTIDNIDTTSQNIDATIKKYQAIDSALKDTINSSIKM